MAGTISIPLVTLPAGSRDFGPAPVPDGDSLITITIDRTVTNGLNSKTAATLVTLTSYQSGDSGATWNELSSATAPGGIFVKNGVTAAASVIGVGLWPGTSRQVKANLTVAGSSVAVAGTVATQ